MSEITSTKIHQTGNGKWVPCTATQRACPRGNHLTISGDPKVAAEFFNSAGVPAAPKGKAAASGPRQAGLGDIEAILRSEFKGVAVSKREDLTMRVWVALQYGAERPLTQAAYREVYGKVAGAIAGVYERENTKGDPNVAARRIFLANGWPTTYGRTTFPSGADRVGNPLRVVDERVGKNYPISSQHLREGQILVLDRTRYEIKDVIKSLNRMVARKVVEGKVHAVKLNPAFTDHSPHTTKTFSLDVDSAKEYTIYAEPNPFD